MRYRRLGQTDFMVSEIGLDARALLRSDVETAEATLRAAVVMGVTVVTWDVSDAAEDVEPLIARAAGSDRGRLLLVARLDHIPAPEDMGPQAEAITSRLGSELDVLALPGALDEPRRRALEEVCDRGAVRLPARWQDDTVEVVGGRIVRGASSDEVTALLAERDVACVVREVATPGDLRAALAG